MTANNFSESKWQVIMNLLYSTLMIRVLTLHAATPGMEKKKKRNLFLICARSLRIFSGQEADCSIRAEEERTSKHPA